ncbi:MAG: SDR family oxidoreductase [Lachnospiraceae bacterium]|jgi:NAD(P)-dependent dehydrogenase (short-subunit alcohol dehydrogenase family)|nr:SDR family oxidoreductase [Lachnospiraceae bacterium]
MSEYKKFSYDLLLTGKVAVISGGTSGIGKSIAEVMAYRGAKVIILGRKQVEETAKELGAAGKVLELRDRAAMKKVVEEIAKEYGTIDILVNSAGIGSGVPAAEISEEEVREVLNVNLESAFFLTQEVGKVMIASGRGGRIINIASDAGISAVENHLAYSASKAGLLSVTRTLALEWGKYGITANAISPTVVMTPMSRAYWVGERAEKRLAQMPVGRFGEMDEIAAAAAFLASDGAQMINGHNLVIDGGLSIC